MDEEKAVRYEPVDHDTAASLLGEGIHVGLRKGTDAANSHETWQAIGRDDSGWSDAIDFAVYGLEQMGYAVCKKVQE